METLGVVSLSEQSPDFYIQKAFNLIKIGQITDAIRCMDTAIIFSHNAPFYIFQKVKLLYYFGDQASCNSFIISQLNYLYQKGSLYILCRILCYLQRINHYSLDALKTLLSNNSIPYCLADCYPVILRRKYKPLYHIAHKAMIQDDYPLCIAYLEICLKCTYAFKHYPDIYYHLGYAHHMLGQLLNAQKYYELYFQLQPYAADAYLNLGFVSMEMGDYTTAIHYFNKACLMAPDHPYYPLYLGECYYLAKKYSKAISTYQKFAKMHPDNLQVYFNLSHTYKKMSKRHLSKYYNKHIHKQIQKQQHVKENKTHE